MIILQLFSRKWVLATVLVIAGAAVCARLGIWQLDRLAQRREFNSHVNAMRAMPPLQLPAEAGAEDLPGMEYRTAIATGTYDFANQVAIRNQSYNDQYGMHLLTPLVMKNGLAVLVDRGWIPVDAGATTTPADWQKYNAPTGEVSVHGIVRQSQTTAYFGGVTDPTLTPGQRRLDEWIYVNIDRIARQMPYPILPIYVQQDPQPNRVNPPIPYQAELDLSEGPHQGYAIQWFSFAVIMLVGYPFYIRQHNKEAATAKK